MIDIDTDTYIGSPPRGGGGDTRTIIEQVSLHRLRMNVVHLVDSPEGIIDAIAEAQADTPRVRFVIEEDALGNYWDWGDNGIPGIIRDGDDGFWPDGEDLFYSVLTPSDLPTAREVWYNNYSSYLPFLNIAPTSLKENFALYDSTEYSAYTVNITQAADDQSAARNSGRGNAPDGYIPTQAEWKIGGKHQFYIWMNEVQFDFSAV